MNIVKKMFARKKMEMMTFHSKIHNFSNCFNFWVKIKLHTLKIRYFDKKIISILRGVCHTTNTL